MIARKLSGLGDVGLRPLRADEPAVIATRPPDGARELYEFLSAERNRLRDDNAPDVLWGLAVALAKQHPGLTALRTAEA